MNKIISNIRRLKSLLNKLKNENKKIVFTNGCFDIIHSGHIYYLKEAKTFGDILVVALNSDNSIKRIKGKNRPIISEKNRLIIMESLYFVDYVTIFNEDTPYNLIKEITPNILVKGGDWEINKIVGKDIVEKNGGKVINIPYQKGISTTEIINRIKSIYC